MSTLLTTDPSTCTETLELRISRGGEPIDRLGLPEGKCTIGSSPSCHIRLEGSSVRPLQCLLVRKGSEVTVTRWAAGILLNENDFTTATLRLGDHLSIGEFALQLFDLNSPSEPCNSEPTESVEETSVALIDEVAAQVAAEVDHVELVPETAEATVVTVAEVPPSLEADLAKLHAANQQARQRFRKLIGTLRELREESHGLDQHVNMLTEQLQSAQQSRENLTSELHQVQAVAVERESQFGEELDRAIAELSTSYEKSNVLEQQWQTVRDQNEALQGELAALHAKVFNFEQVQVGWTEEKQRLEAELASREGDLSRLYEELAGIKAFFEASVLELQQNSETQQQRLAATITERESEIELLRQRLNEAGSEQEHFVERMIECEREIAELRQDLDTSTAHEQQLSATIAERESEIELLRQRLNEAGSEQVRFVERIGECEREIAELRQGLDTSTAHEQQLSATIAERESEIAQLHQGLEASVAELHDQNEVLRGQLAQLSGECEQYKLQNSGQAESLSAITEANTALQNQLAIMASEFDKQRAELESRVHAAEHAAAEATLKSETPDPALIELDAELGAVRGERQKLAEDNHRLNEQIAEAEKKIQLLEIDVRSANAEWQRAQASVVKLKDECLTAEAHAADLDAKLADLANFTAVEHASERDLLVTELSRLKQDLTASEESLAEMKNERDRLGVEISSLQQDLALKVAALENHADENELKRAELDNLKQESTSREQLITELTNQFHRVEAELSNLRQVLSEKETTLAKYQDVQGLSSAELESLNQELASRESALADLKSQLEQRGMELASLKQVHFSKEVEFAALEAERNQSVSMLKELEQQFVKKEADLVASEQLLNELQAAAQLGNQAEKDFATELMLRDSRIEELATELRFMQDQLTDCAAQGERLNDLYQQAQLELAALSTAEPTSVSVEQAVEEEIEVDLPIADDLSPQSPAWPEEDPRDDDESRIVRALASVSASVEPEKEEVEQEAFQPASFIDRYSHIFDENGEAPQMEASRADVPTKHSEPDSLLDCGDDSAALEAYMANMMRRVRGENSSEAISPPLGKSPQEPSSNPIGNPVARMNTLTKRVATVSEPTEPAEGLIDLSELKGTSQKPPLPTSLSAMRELANISARQAIAKHRKRRHFEGALSKLLVSGIAGGTAAYMLLTADKITSPYFLAGCGVAIVSGYWGFKLLGILLEMIRDGINDEQLPAELDDNATPLPIDSPAK